MKDQLHASDGADPARTGPLAGVRVLDMTSVLLGPLATVMMADLGADVIKVESPRGIGGGSAPGDVWRYAGDTPVKGLGPMFAALNRNKRSVGLDLSLEEDAALFRDLIAWADVFIHNIRMAGMRRLGFDYAGARAINPGLVYVHCAGFGEDGPYSALPAYDDLIQGVSGFTDLAARRDGEAPDYAPSGIADKTVGLFAANATLAAYVHRLRTGEGQFVQVPMFECFTFFNHVEHLYGQTWASVDKPMCYSRSINPERRPYRTADGYIAIVPYSDDQWRRFLNHGGYPDVMDDPRFSTYTTRTENIGALYAHIRAAAASRTTAEWLEFLQREDIPAMRCHTVDETLEDPHLQAVDFWQIRTHPEGGPYRAMKHPVKYAGSPAEIYRDPPVFGEHTEAVRAAFSAKPRKS